MWSARGEEKGQCLSLPLLIPSSLPRFSLTCSALMPHKNEAEANLLPAAAPGKQTSLQLHPNELLTGLVLHSDHCKHRQSLISGVKVWPFSQTQEALHTPNTSVHCPCCLLFIIDCIGKEHCGKRERLWSYDILQADIILLLFHLFFVFFL